MQTGAAALSRELSSRFKENTGGTRLLRELQLPAMQETFLGRITKPQPTMSLESQGLCTPGSGSSILDKCTLQPSCTELFFVLHLFLMSTATKKLP